MSETSYADRYLDLRDKTPMFLKLLRSNPSMFERFGMEGFELAPGKAEEAPVPEPEPVARAGGEPVDELPLDELDEKTAAALERFNAAHDGLTADEDAWQSSELPGQAEHPDLPRPAQPAPVDPPTGPWRRGPGRGSQTTQPSSQ